MLSPAALELIGEYEEIRDRAFEGDETITVDNPIYYAGRLLNFAKRKPRNQQVPDLNGRYAFRWVPVHHRDTVIDLLAEAGALNKPLLCAEAWSEEFAKFAGDFSG